MKRQIILSGNELKTLVENKADDIVKNIIERNKRKNLAKYITEKFLTRDELYRMAGLSENIEFDDYGEISNALEECGWSYSDAYDVQNGDKYGIRYILHKNSGKSMDAEQMKQRMTELLGADNIIFSEGQHRYAPEIKNLSMVVIDNGNDYIDDNVTESKQSKKTLNENQNNIEKKFDDFEKVETLGDGIYTGTMAGYVFNYDGKKYKMPYGIRCSNPVNKTIEIKQGEVY